MKTAGTKEVINELLIEGLNLRFGNILSEGLRIMMVECCVMSLHVCRHTSGEAKLLPHDVIGNMMKVPKILVWQKEVDDIMLRTHNDDTRTTDFGAMCMSLLLMSEITDGKYLWTTSAKGDGVDFWLSDPETFNPVARLEISGIRSATTKNNVTNRLNIKKKQTKSSESSNVPAYITIVEFSKPTAAIVTHES